MSITLRKVWRDLWHSKFRTVLIVLATATGVFALGFVYGTSGTLNARLAESHRASVPPHLTFYTGPFDQESVEMLKRNPDIAHAEGVAALSFQWKLEGDTEWQTGVLFARDDYEAQSMNVFGLLKGEWPTRSRTKREMAVERLTSRHYHIPVGATVIAKFGRSERRLAITGMARNPQAVTPPLNPAVFFAAPETLSWLIDWPGGFNRLYVRLASFEERMPDEDSANAAAEQLEEQLTRMGIQVGLYTVTDPDVHPLQETVEALGLILTVLGALALALSGFLILNMMNALVATQVWQIGVLKVLGATFGRVIQTYLATALVYGVLSLLPAVPAAAIAAYLLASVLLGLFNVDPGPIQVVPRAIGIQVTVGLLVPLVAALIPAIGGALLTPHQAIGSYGLGAGFGRSWLDRLVGRVRNLPRTLALGLRNTFRRKGRIALTMVTLVLGGTMFIVVASVGASMTNTIDTLLDDLGFDVLAVFGRAYHKVSLAEVSESVPGVTRAELWDQRAAQIALAGGEERETYLWGVPADSEMFAPRIISGRGLRPDDGRVILLNSKIAGDQDIQVGDVLELTIGERTSTWTVVGLILNVNNLQRDSFVPFDALARETGNINRGGLLMIKSEKHDAATHVELMRDLKKAYEARHMELVIMQSAGEVRQQNQAVFSTITYLMLAMTVLAAVVGSIGLMSTMSINVVERRREIGVLRAIGATSFSILGVFVTEGVLAGAISWLCALPLSYPGARVFSNLVSNKLFQIPLDFDYSVGGTVLWLVIVVVLSALASLWPALSAAQVTVRESLAYE